MVERSSSNPFENVPDEAILAFVKQKVEEGKKYKKKTAAEIVERFVKWYREARGVDLIVDPDKDRDRVFYFGSKISARFPKDDTIIGTEINLKPRDYGPLKRN